MSREHSAVGEALADVRAACAELSVPWYLFGAQAALVYGSPRLTADIDITVQLGSVTAEALLAALVKRGFEPRFDDPGFVATTRVLPVVHQATPLLERLLAEVE